MGRIDKEGEEEIIKMVGLEQGEEINLCKKYEMLPCCCLLITIEKRLEEQKLNKKEKKGDDDDEIDPGEDEQYCGGQIHRHLLGDDGPDHQRVMILMGP